MNLKKQFLFFLFCFSLFSISIDKAFSQTSLPFSHKGQITNIFAQKDYFFTSASDGFIIRWDASLNPERMQVSDIEIQKIAVHPNGNLIALYETDGLSIFRLSVWDWSKKERLYAKRLPDKITSLSFSQKGSYILIGNGNYDGLIILEAAYGLQMQVINNSIPQVILAETSATESTLVSYSQSGLLIYTSLEDGSRKSAINTEKTLENGSFLDINKRFFAGIKNKQLYIIDATNGLVQNRISVQKPILISGFSNQEFYILDQLTTESYSLKKISLEKGSSQFKINSDFRFESSIALSTATLLNGFFYLGTIDGSLLSLDTNFNSSSFVKKIAESSKQVFIDITKDRDYFYLLTNEALYRISETQKQLTKIIDNQNWKNILVDGNSIYLYSKGEREAIVSYSLYTDSFEELFIPQLVVENLKVYDSQLIVLLSSTILQSYNLETKELDTVYTGTGLNDFVLKDNSLFISKSAATNPRTALLEINSKTKETVLLPLTNDFIYALDEDISSPYIYGLSINTIPTGFSTELFYYHKDRKTYTSLLRLQDENINAFVTIQDSLLYTNLGKNEIRIVDLKNNRTQSLPKTNALAKKIIAIGKKVLVLNQDGTVTWYQSTQVLKEWNASNPENLSL